MVVLFFLALCIGILLSIHLVYAPDIVRVVQESSDRSFCVVKTVHRTSQSMSLKVRKFQDCLEPMPLEVSFCLGCATCYVTNVGRFLEWKPMAFRGYVHFPLIVCFRAQAY
jgi:hypothetical protein